MPGRTAPSQGKDAMELRLKNKRAIVTGASRGIGAAIAAELAGEGVRVALAARDAARLREVAGRLERGGGEAVIVPADLTRGEDCARVVEAAVEALGGLDILVNNAGATKRGDFLSLGDDDYLDGFALKFHGYVRMCRNAWPHLKASGGTIINVVGVGSRTPTADFTIGGPVNSALVNFTKALAERGLDEGIRINAVNPGPIETDRLTRRLQVAANERGVTVEAIRKTMPKEMQVARFGRPAEIGQLVAFLCSDQAGFIHGATIDIDGGATRGI
jgi:3-oxoacyl-[acyl-carrier protein] reductase